MMKSLEHIYYRLHGGATRSASGITSTADAMKYLLGQRELHPTNGLYRRLISDINRLRETYLPSGFIERFCIGQLSEYILLKYPLNIAEAYLLSYLLLVKHADIHSVYYKLGNSGLIGHTQINGVMITDVEAVSQFMMKSLANAELIMMTDSGHVLRGKNFYIDLLDL
jgi:hypothetical protein